MLAAQGIGVVHLKLHPVSHTSRLGVGPRQLDGRQVEVAADNARLGVGLGHGDRRQARAAAKIQHTAAGLELLFDAVQGRDPVLDQVVLVPGHGHALHAFPGFQRERLFSTTTTMTEGLDDLGRHAHERHAQLNDAAGEIRRVFIGQHWHKFSWHLVAASLRVVGHVIAGGHAAQPFAQVTRVIAGLVRQLFQGHRLAVGQCLEQAELVADVEHGTAQRVAVILHDARRKLLDLGFINFHNVGHLSLLGEFTSLFRDQ